MSNENFHPLPFAAAEFADNPEPRCPVLLLLDNSYSMRGTAIQQLNQGLQIFKDELMSDSLAVKRCEIAVVSFGPVQVVSDFQTADAFTAPHLTASSDTPMGEAILTGLELLKQRKEAIRLNGIGMYRPWVFLITDGGPTDAWKAAAREVHEGEKQHSFAFFAVGVEGANMDVLKQISVRDPLRLSGLKFRELFQWLSSSLKSVSKSNPGDQIKLESPSGWASL